ncbi:MAG: hypothetical protein WBP69_15495, partial [Terriglobales bacterium]
TPNLPVFVIPSEAMDLQSDAKRRFLASLGMTIHKNFIVPQRARLSPQAPSGREEHNSASQAQAIF